MEFAFAVSLNPQFSVVTLFKLMWITVRWQVRPHPAYLWRKPVDKNSLSARRAVIKRWIARRSLIGRREATTSRGAWPRIQWRQTDGEGTGGMGEKTSLRRPQQQQQPRSRPTDWSRRVCWAGVTGQWPSPSRGKDADPVPPGRGRCVHSWN